MERLSAGIASENAGWNERLELMRSKVEETKRVFGTESPEYAKMLLEETKMEAEQTKERMKILSQWDAQTREINAKRLESDIKTNDEASKTASDYYQKRFSLGEINVTELARVETQLANDRYATEQELLGKELTLWSSEPTKYQEVLNQIKAASQKNATDIQKIQEDLAKNNSQAWNSFLSPLTSAFDRTVGKRDYPRHNHPAAGHEKPVSKHSAFFYGHARQDNGDGLDGRGAEEIKYLSDVCES